MVAVPEEQGWYLRRADEMEGKPIMDLQVTDERFEGMTFSGTTKSIYNEMKALKPEIFTAEIEAAMDAAALNAGVLEKRSSVSHILFIYSQPKEGR